MPPLVLAVLSLVLLTWGWISLFATDRWMAFLRRAVGDRWRPFWTQHEALYRFNTRCSGVVAMLMAVFLTYVAGAMARIW
jgi:hypothetical protein